MYLIKLKTASKLYKKLLITQTFNELLFLLNKRGISLASCSTVILSLTFQNCCHICSVSRKGQSNLCLFLKQITLHRLRWKKFGLLCVITALLLHCLMLLQQLSCLPHRVCLLIKHPHHQAASCQASLEDAN